MHIWQLRSVYIRCNEVSNTIVKFVHTKYINNQNSQNVAYNIIFGIKIPDYLNTNVRTTWDYFETYV